MAPKRIGTVISVRLPEDLLKDIDSRSIALGCMTRAEAIRRLLRIGLQPLHRIERDGL